MTITPAYLARSGTEQAHQTALCQWVAFNKQAIPELGLLFAIPNGGSRNKAEAARLVASGVRAGVPDLMLPVSRPKTHDVPTTVIWHGLFIEMKKPGRQREKNGGCSPEQVTWINALWDQDYLCVVCYSWDQAAREILKYLGKEINL